MMFVILFSFWSMASYLALIFYSFALSWACITGGIAPEPLLVGTLMNLLSGFV